MKTALIISFMAAALLGCGESDQSRQRKLVASALGYCQEALLSQAAFGDAERPPYRNPTLSGNAILFEWERGAFHFKNGFGARVPQSAECIALSGNVSFLKLNDKILIDR